ncbi:MAG: DUF5076 domain-containing protein, partial [Edaphobacter sp.]
MQVYDSFVRQQVNVACSARGIDIIMSSEKILGIPPAAQRDKSSFEVMRVWIAEQGQHVSIQSGA